MTPTTSATRAVCIASLALLGCERNGTVSSTTTTTSAVIPLANDTAIDEVASARCARENACNNVGARRMWETLDSCMRDERDIAREAISVHRCPHGVDASALPDCVEAIQREACTAPSLPSACLKTYLCL